MTTTPGTPRFGLFIAFVFVLAACGSDGSTASPSATPAVAPSPVASAIVSAAPSSGPKPGQTDTDWGRIWDSLPPGFPTAPGATPDEDAAGGPASAVLVVEGLDAKGVAAFLQTVLQSKGYTAVGSSEPLEDGSYVLDMTGTPEGCALRVTATPTGGLTTVRILYGATCPFG